MAGLSIETRHDRANMNILQRLDMTELTWTETRHDRANMDRQRLDMTELTINRD